MASGQQVIARTIQTIVRIVSRARSCVGQMTTALSEYPLSSLNGPHEKAQGPGTAVMASGFLSLKPKSVPNQGGFHDGR